MSCFISQKKIPQINIKVLDDQSLRMESIGKELNKTNPDVIGIICIFNNYNEALGLARRAKNNDAKVIMGGQYATALAKEIITNRGVESNDYCIDVVVRQDGERGFYQYVAKRSLSKIDNLVYKRDRKVIKNKLKLLKLNDVSFSESNILDPKPYFKEYQKI